MGSGESIFSHIFEAFADRNVDKTGKTIAFEELMSKKQDLQLDLYRLLRLCPKT